MYKRVIAYTILIVAILGLMGMAGCSRQNQNPLTKQQIGVLNKLLACKVTDKQIETVKLQKEVAQKFPAVDKMFKITANKEERYGFVVSPVGYRAPINMMVVIDAKKNYVMGIKIMQQDETPGYGEWLAETWFTNRFKEKSVDKYLERAILEAENSNEIVQITSATVTTQAVLNGVNAAMGIYREVVLGQEAASVPLKPEGFITES